MQYLPWFFFGCNTHKGHNDFFSQKLFKPRRPFFYTSKYGNWRFFRKKNKFFYSRVFEIFYSKHGSPENYSDFFCFLFFVFLLLPDRVLCVLRAITSRRYWAIGTKFRRHSQGWIWLSPELFGFIRFRGFGVRGPQNGRILPCYFRQNFEILRFSHELYFVV